MSKVSNYLENALEFKYHGLNDEYSEHINDELKLDVKFATEDEDGETPADLIAVAIGRLNMENEESPSREASLAITKLEEALLWLHYRTVGRTRRHVEGTKEE